MAFALLLPSQPVKADQAGPARLQVAGGFFWDLGLSSLTPAAPDAGARDGDSSDGDDHEETDKVGTHPLMTTLTTAFYLK